MHASLFVHSHQEQKVFQGEQFPCQSFPFLFTNRSRVVWQQYFECLSRHPFFFIPFCNICSLFLSQQNTTAKIVPAPEVYQCHFFVAYQETPKKKTGACVVLSTAAIYICTLKSGLPAAVKDKFAADKLTALAAVPGNDRAVRLTIGDATPVCVAATADERNALFVPTPFSHTRSLFRLSRGNSPQDIRTAASRVGHAEGQSPCPELLSAWRVCQPSTTIVSQSTSNLTPPSHAPVKRSVRKPPDGCAEVGRTSPPSNDL